MPCCLGQNRHGTHDGMPGTELLMLMGIQNIGLVGDSAFYLFGLMAHHNNQLIPGNGSCRIHHIGNHGFPVDLMQNLGSIGFHSGAKAGCQNNNGNIRRISCHDCNPL